MVWRHEDHANDDGGVVTFGQRRPCRSHSGSRIAAAVADSGFRPGVRELAGASDVGGDFLARGDFLPRAGIAPAGAEDDLARAGISTAGEGRPRGREFLGAGSLLAGSGAGKRLETADESRSNADITAARVVVPR